MHLRTSLSIYFLCLFSISCGAETTSNPSADPMCLQKKAPKLSILDVEQDLTERLSQSGLKEPLLVAQFLHQNRASYRSVFARVAFNLSEAGCSESEETIEQISLGGLLNHTNIKVFNGTDLGDVFGIRNPRVTDYVQVSLDGFYWDYGIYWIMIGHAVDGDQAKTTIIDFGVDD